MSDIKPNYNINGLGNGLITGLQGAGKSHFVMTQIKCLLDNTDINIYLINVDGVTLEHDRLTLANADFNWIKDAEKNSIVIYDEAGTIERFSNSSKTINSNPEVAQLTMLRHHGKQVFFVAQDPSLLHPAVRKLMVRHLHFSNPYNDPNKTHCFVFPQTIDRIDSVSKTWKKSAIQEFDHTLYPEIFALYKSVDDGASHVKTKQVNHKARRVFIAVAIIAVLALLAFATAVYFGLSWYRDFNKLETTEVIETVTEQVNPVSAQVVPVNQMAQMADDGNAMYAREQALYAERLPNDYKLLSANDELRVSAVMVMGNICRAYNAKGEQLTISDDDCHLISIQGIKIKGGQKNQLITQHAMPQQQSSSHTLEQSQLY